MMYKYLDLPVTSHSMCTHDVRMMCLIFVLTPPLHVMGGACDQGKRKDHQGKLEGRPEVPLLQDLPSTEASGLGRGGMSTY